MHVCDGCGEFFNYKLKIINAKMWRSEVCDRSLKWSYECKRYGCKFRMEDEGCMEFQFCSSCLKKQSLLDRNFLSIK